MEKIAKELKNRLLTISKNIDIGVGENEFFVYVLDENDFNLPFPETFEGYSVKIVKCGCVFPFKEMHTFV